MVHVAQSWASWHRLVSETLRADSAKLVSTDAESKAEWEARRDSVDVKQGKRRAVEALKQLNADLPVARGYTEVKFDREQAFTLYATFSGDIEKTAHALNANPIDVLRAADEGEWQGRLQAIFKLKQIGRPGDVERTINRAQNFAQASRMRMFFEKMVHKFYTMTDEELVQYCFSTVETRRKGSDDVTLEYKLNTRPFADFASALEKIHVLTYLALGDSAAERRQREDKAPDESVQDVHAAIADAVAKAAGDQSPRAKLFDEQLATAQNIMEGQPRRDPSKTLAAQLSETPPARPPGVTAQTVAPPQQEPCQPIRLESGTSSQ